MLGEMVRVCIGGRRDAFFCSKSLKCNDLEKDKSGVVWIMKLFRSFT